MCGRTCAWYNSLGSLADPNSLKSTYLAASRSSTSDLRFILTQQDVLAFDAYCAAPGSQFFGFSGRGAADRFSRAQAIAGAQYYWNAALQLVPGLNPQKRSLQEAQCAYFVTVVLCKVMTVVVSKTRRLSLFQHGMLGNR